MECETITFSDYSLLSPKKVHAIRSELCLEFERRKLSDKTQTEHLGLKNTLRLLSVESPPLKHRSESGDPWSPLSSVSKQSTPGLGDVELVFDQKMFENVRREVWCPCRRIEQRAKWWRYGNALPSFRREIACVSWSMQHCSDDSSISWSCRCDDVKWSQ